MKNVRERVLYLITYVYRRYLSEFLTLHPVRELPLPAHAIVMARKNDFLSRRVDGIIFVQLKKLFSFPNHLIQRTACTLYGCKSSIIKKKKIVVVITRAKFTSKSVNSSTRFLFRFVKATSMVRNRNSRGY